MRNLRLSGASNKFLRPQDLIFALRKRVYHSRPEGHEKNREPYAPLRTGETLRRWMSFVKGWEW